MEAEGTHDEAPGDRRGPRPGSPTSSTPPGSTGRPKGVAVTHGSVVNLFDHWRDRMGDAPGEASSAWSSIGFDASVHELLVPLTTGGGAPPGPRRTARRSRRRCMGWMREHEVTQAFLPPSYVMWIDEDPARGWPD